MEDMYGRGDPRGAAGGGDAGYDMEEEEDMDVRLSQNQARLLFFLSLYSGPAERAEDSERWIKDTSMNVLIYEAIVAQVLDYDYAPASVMVNGRRMYFNVSQEGKSDLDFLREEELVNGLKISTTAHLPITMIQISLKGIRALAAVDEFDRNAVYRVALSPSRALLQVETTAEGEFELVARSEDGSVEFVRPSTVLSIEEVSYCSSAYIPACLRHGGRPTLSNAHRVEEVTRAQATSIRDDLEEVLSLNSVSVIVAEWIPFGPSQMVELNMTLGSPERVLGGFFTAAVRDNGVTSSFQMDPGLTAVQILDYSLAGHVNLEADIRLPEPEGIVQIETFGVSLHASGSALFGLQLEAVMDRVKDAISLDHLSRLLVDVQTDSSEIVEPLLSPAQRRMLDLAYRGDSANRNKVNLIISNEITPHLTAEEYLDRDVYENELRQVIGDTRAAFDVTEQDTLVFGSEGLLLAGPNSRTYEPLLVAYAQLLAMDLFSQNLFSVVHVIRDDIRATAAQVKAARRDPLALREGSQRLPSLNRTVVQIEKIVSFMEESLLAMELPEAPMTAAGRSLYERLACPDMQSDMARRVTDLSKYIKELQQELQVLQLLTQTTLDEARSDVSKAAAKATAGLLQATHDPRVTRTSRAVETLQYLVIALVVYATLDRLVGTWSVADTDWFRNVYIALFTRGASVWFWISIILAAGAVAGTWWYFQQWWRALEEDVVHVSLELRRRIMLEKLHHLLTSRTVLSSSWSVTPEGDSVVVSWVESSGVEEHWNGEAPIITAEYSAQLSKLIRLDVTYRRARGKDPSRKPSEQDIREIALRILSNANVLRDDPQAPNLVMGATKDAFRGAQIRSLAGTYGQEDGDDERGHLAGVDPNKAAAARAKQLRMAEGDAGEGRAPESVPVQMGPDDHQHPPHQGPPGEYGGGGAEYGGGGGAEYGGGGAEYGGGGGEYGGGGGGGGGGEPAYRGDGEERFDEGGGEFGGVAESASMPQGAADMLPTHPEPSPGPRAGGAPEFDDVSGIHDEDEKADQ